MGVRIQRRKVVTREPEDVKVAGANIASGGRKRPKPRIVVALDQRGPRRDDDGHSMMPLVGEMIPDADAGRLCEISVARAFPVGSFTSEIAASIREVLDRWTRPSWQGIFVEWRLSSGM